MKNPEISFLITAWKEEKTIGKAIESIAKVQYSGLSVNYEILLAAPDKETQNAALKTAIELDIQNNFRLLKDPGGGKNVGLNILIKNAKGKYWVFTDGDVYFAEGAVKAIYEKAKKEDQNDLFLITGRPVSDDSKKTMMGYFGNLLADAANHKRVVTLTNHKEGNSQRFISKAPFFPVSGYIYLAKGIDNEKFNFPKDTLVDDAYISYWVYNKGGKILYEEDAKVKVKYPKTLRDYFKQKRRSAGGYVQLWKYDLVKPETVTRSFWKELEYFWYPLTYAKNMKQFFWSIYLYFVRAAQWALIYWDQKIKKKDMMDDKTGWERIESTK